MRVIISICILIDYSMKNKWYSNFNLINSQEYNIETTPVFTVP